jgi:diguanylate cyclase (GGDEF)-like protein/PAS domain S-box-containing protein
VSSRSADTLTLHARRAALCCALLAVLIGLVGLAGWLLDVETLTHWGGGLRMKANTGVTLALLGAATALQIRARHRTRLIGALHAAGTLLPVLTAVEWLSGRPLGIDHLLAADPTAIGAAGRISPASGACLLALSGALLAVRRQRVDSRLVGGLVWAPVALATLAVVAHASGVGAVTEHEGIARISLPAAVAMTLLGLALVLERPERGGLRLLVSTGPGGIVARRLGPLVVLVPIAVSALRQAATLGGVITERQGDWLFVFALVLLLAGVVLHLARGLDLADLARAHAVERLKASEALARAVTDSAHDAIVGLDRHGAVTLFNPAAEALFGWTSAEILGRPFTALIAERDRAACVPGVLLEVVGVAKGGREFDLGLTLAEVHDVDGVSTTAVMRDISERKRAEAREREDAERIRRVVGAQSTIGAAGGDLVETMERVALEAAEIIEGADGAVVELPDGEDMVYRAAVGSAASTLGTRICRRGSLSGAALATGETLHCDDSDTDPRVDRDACRRVGLRSMICVPLQHREQTVGVLKVTSARPHAFAPHDGLTLELLASLAGAAVRRAQDERRLAAHRTAAEELAGAVSLEAGLAGVLRGMADELGWEVGAVWLAERDGSLACAQTFHDERFPCSAYRTLVQGREPADSSGLVATARATGATVWLEEPGESPEHCLDPARGRAAAACGLRTLVAAPITAGGQTLGVVELAARERRTHDADTLAIVAAIAQQIGQFVQRRVAEERVAAQAANLAAVAELGRALSATHDPASTRPTLVDGIRELTAADQVTLLEPDGEDRLVVTAQAGSGVGAGHGFDLACDPVPAVQVFHAGRGRFIADFESEPAGARFDPVAGLRSAHFEPLMRDGAVVGVLSVASRERRAHDAGGLDQLMRLLAVESASALAISDLVATLGERARTDELTGVANRRAWDHELPRELSRSARTGTPLSVAVLDLDHFKDYNDTYGHPAGDRLLRAAAAGWSARLRATDLLARYGGEEFAVVLPNCDAESAARVADDLRRALPDGSSCSIGVATWDGREAPGALVARADAALYRAKRAGRDRVVCD